MPNSFPDKVCQVNLLHISDLHFGKYHRFQSDVTPMAEHAADARFPTLAQKFSEDIRSLKLEGPVVLCCTGDFVETANIEEYSSAEKFLQHIMNVAVGGSSINKNSLFMVPGNHDVVYDKSEIGYRFQQWTEFYNRLHGSNFKREDPWGMCSVHDRIDSHGLVVVTLNSSIYI
ncbi:metallophosphoesterase [Rhizobium laguerreae]